MSVQIRRSCDNCGGKVFISRQTLSIPHPHAGTFNIPSDATITINGLGTWKCVNSCPKRTVKVEVYTPRCRTGQNFTVRDRIRPIAVNTFLI